MATAALVVNLLWDYGTGSPGANVWHLRSDATSPDQDGFGGGIGAVADFYTAISSLLGNGLTWEFDGLLQGVGANSGTTYEGDSFNGVSAGTGTSLSTALQMCVAWHSNTGGRSGQGRTFVGPLISSAATQEGLPTAAAVAQLKSAADALVEDSDSLGDGAVGIYSRKTNVFRDVVRASVRSQFAVLRSRRD